MRVRTPEALRRRRADQEALARGRATALYLSERSPGWLLHYGPASRRYWAFPLWRDAPTGPVSAADPGRLLEYMREAERTRPTAVLAPSP